MTPLPAIDVEQVEQFWARFVASGAVDVGTPKPRQIEPFGDSVELADELLELVIHGPKRATAGAVAEYEHDGDPLPVAGGVSIATDGSGKARAVLRSTEVRIGPLSSVDDAFAWDEGEGDRSLTYWLETHRDFFARVLPAIGIEFDDEMTTVFERFEVLYTED